MHDMEVQLAAEREIHARETARLRNRLAITQDARCAMHAVMVLAEERAKQAIGLLRTAPLHFPECIGEEARTRGHEWLGRCDTFLETVKNVVE